MTRVVGDREQVVVREAVVGDFGLLVTEHPERGHAGGAARGIGEPDDTHVPAALVVDAEAEDAAPAQVPHPHIADTLTAGRLVQLSRELGALLAGDVVDASVRVRFAQSLGQL